MTTRGFIDVTRLDWLPASRLALAVSYLLFVACLQVALYGSSGVFDRPIPVHKRLPSIAPGEEAAVLVRTDQRSVLGLSRCDPGAPTPLRFVPSDGSTAWEFRCTAPSWGDRLEWRPSGPREDDRTIEIDGTLIAPPTAAAGRVPGTLTGQVTAPIREPQGAFFRNRVLEIQQTFEVRVTDREVFRARRSRRVLLFWLAIPVGLAALVAAVAIGEKRKAPRPA